MSWETRVRTKDSEMVLHAALLNTYHYKEEILGKITLYMYIYILAEEHGTWPE